MARVKHAVGGALLALGVLVLACHPNGQPSPVGASEAPAAAGTPGEGRPDGATEPAREMTIRLEDGGDDPTDELAEDADAGTRLVGGSALARRLGQALGSAPERYGVVVEHIPTRLRFVHQPRRPFPAGSVYKLAVAHEVLHRADLG